MQDNTDDKNQKLIPENAAQQEQANTDADSGEMAGKETKAISKGKLKKVLEDSRDKTSIAIEDIYRWGILFLFGVACLAILYMSFQITCLISSYVDHVRGDQVQLKELLRDIWKVLSGASVVVFVQAIGWMIKNRHDGIK